MLIDYHTHHYRCGHAIGTLREYIEQGIIKGLTQIGLSDHMPIIHLKKEKILPGLAMDVKELENYFTEAWDLKAEYKKEIDVKVGVEADYVEGFEEQIYKLLSQLPFDYILGSVHFLGEWDFSDSRQMYFWNDRPIDDIYDDYYRAIRNLAKSKLYDIVGHFDVIKKYGHKPAKDMSSIIGATLSTIKENDMAIEINASGLKRAFMDTYPTKSIIEEAINKQIPITLGSDAHKPTDVHSGLDEARVILKSLDVTELATFDKRKRIMLPYY